MYTLPIIIHLVAHCIHTSMDEVHTILKKNSKLSDILILQGLYTNAYTVTHNEFH